MLILEEKLSDKEAEIKRLRHQLQQHDMEEEKTERLVADKTDTDENVTAVSTEPEPELEPEIEIT